MDEKYGAIGSVGKRDIRGDESIIQRRETLLAIQNDVFRIAPAIVPWMLASLVVESVNDLARQRIEALPLALPKQNATDVVI